VKTAYFNDSYVIGLPRLGRIPRFFAEFPRDWPVPKPKLFRGIDGTKVPIPKWWQPEIPGLYGCGESHRAVIAQALSCNYEQIVIFEDDCGFVPDQAEHVREFLKEVPDDWDAILFGGQVSCFDGRTERVSERVSKCVQVERLHAYALSQRGMRVFYEALSNGERVANDYKFGDLQEQGKLITYRIEPFVCFQTDGRSAISGRIEANRIWDERVDVRLRDPASLSVIALVCPFPVMEQLRDEGIVTNGGESPPFMSQVHPGTVEASEMRVAQLTMQTFEHDPARAIAAIDALKRDAAFHRDALFVTWHPIEPIPYPDAQVVRADTFEQATQALAPLRQASARTIP
jgi:hypothetical protein